MRARRFQLAAVERTGDRIVDLGPFVPAMGEDGRVAFTARRSDGRSVVVVADGEARDEVDFGLELVSHPDLEEEGGIVVFGARPDGRGCLLRTSTRALAGSESIAVGPLGPTIGPRGAVAFRGDGRGGPGIFVATPPGAPRCVASLSDGFTALHGLPLVDPRGAVVFRADRGSESCVLREEQVLLRAPLGALGHFPTLEDDGSVLVVVALANRARVLRLAAGGATEALDTRAFAHVRGALPAAPGAPGAASRLVFASAPGEALAIFDGPDPSADRVLGIGDRIAGGEVEGFALNAVSRSARGQLAIRLELAGGRGAVVRLDPR